MTTFTTEDKIAALKGCCGDCHQGRLECNCREPIPFAGWMRYEPVVIVESGASVMPSVGDSK